MKETKVEEYKIPARNIAEMLWGRGGTQSIRTNRNGAYYFTCSGHGGYIVDSRVLTATEKAAILESVKPIRATLFVQHRTDGDYVIQHDFQAFGGRQNPCRYSIGMGRVDKVEFPVYVFEEDCEWRVLEEKTNIRLRTK